MSLPLPPLFLWAVSKKTYEYSNAFWNISKFVEGLFPVLGHYVKDLSSSRAQFLCHSHIIAFLENNLTIETIMNVCRISHFPLIDPNGVNYAMDAFGEKLWNPKYSRWNEISDVIKSRYIFEYGQEANGWFITSIDL